MFYGSLVTFDFQRIAQIYRSLFECGWGYAENIIKKWIIYKTKEYNDVSLYIGNNQQASSTIIHDI